ncbi:MAG TPA: hypothetical protein VFY40_00715 [Blastocatellia bacterium]|nr:hypothetical protein [Blastocatellia bacterium]
MIKLVRSIAVIRYVSQRLSTNRACAIAVILATTCAPFSQSRAASGESSRYRGGLRNSPGEHKLNAKQLGAVLTSLREKTGLLEMRFDENGFLTLGDQTRFSGGSATARSLLYAVASMADAVDLESHMYSSQVAFARLATPISYYHYPTGTRIDVRPLEIDFSDLTKLRGASQAISAFDLGFMVLHELGHAAFALRDTPDDPKGLGECETLINRIRRELNLPERQRYVAQIYAAPIAPNRGLTRLAELVFAREVEKQGRRQIEKFNLHWEAAAVGPIIDIEDRGPKMEDRSSRIAARGLMTEDRK